MSDFSTQATVGLSIADGDLRDVRQEIETSIGSVSVGVENGQATRPDGGVSTGSLAAGAAVDELGDQTERLGDNLDLNERRNDLLEQLVEQTDDGDLRGRRGSGGGGLAGLLGLGAAGLGIGGAAISKRLKSAVGSVNLQPADVVGGAAELAAGDLVGTVVELGADDVIGSAVELAAGDVLSDPLDTGDLLGDGLPVDVGSVISAAQGAVSGVGPEEIASAGGVAGGAAAASKFLRNPTVASTATATLGPLAGVPLGLAGAAATDAESVGEFNREQGATTTVNGQETGYLEGFLSRYTRPARRQSGIASGAASTTTTVQPAVTVQVDNNGRPDDVASEAADKARRSLLRELPRILREQGQTEISRSQQRRFQEQI